MYVFMNLRKRHLKNMDTTLNSQNAHCLFNITSFIKITDGGMLYATIMNNCDPENESMMLSI